MPKDTQDNGQAEAFPLNGMQTHEKSVDNDARAAFEEVMGRSVSSSTESAPAEPAPDASEKGAASRSSASDKTSKAEVRTDDAGRQRDASGRFTSKDDQAAPKDQAPAEKAASDAAAKPVDGKTAAGDQQAAPAGQDGLPPPSFSVKSKADWAKLPEHVRADIVKREGEMQNGLAALRDYKDLKSYADLATRHGTTIKDYIDRTLRIENTIRQNPQAGIAQILVNMGVPQAQAAQMLGEMATKLGFKGLTGQGQPGAQTPNASEDPLAAAIAPILQPMLQPLMQQLQTMQGAVSARQTADRNAEEAALLTEINNFASDPDNLYFENLAETMTQLMSSGMVPRSGNAKADVQTAYRMAAQLHPEVSEALIEKRIADKAEAQRKADQEAANKARNASRSISGSNMPGARVTEPQGRQSGVSYDDDLMADVQAAFRKHS
jgi:hypothetical protein